MEDQELPYQYQPISASEEIRVLCLQPGTFAEPLIGSLVVRKIGHDEKNPPAYDCVSYCWGTQEHFTSFICDSQNMHITVAVDEMLRHMRQAMELCDLWVDASTYRRMLQRTICPDRFRSLYQSSPYTREEPTSTHYGQNLFSSTECAHLAGTGNRRRFQYYMSIIRLQQMEL